MIRLPTPVCLRCRARVVGEILLSRDTGVLLHAKTFGLTSGMPTICGGVVVPRARSPLEGVARGAVLPAYSTSRSVTPHLVRLGEFKSARSGSWEGKPLCGQGASRGLWIPVPREQVPPEVLCGSCQAVEAGQEKA